MSRAAIRVYALAGTLIFAWIFAMVAAGSESALVTAAVAVTLSLAALAGLYAVNALRGPRQTPATIAIRRRDRDRRRSVVRVADPDAAGRRRPRAPGRPFSD